MSSSDWKSSSIGKPNAEVEVGLLDLALVPDRGTAGKPDFAGSRELAVEEVDPATISSLLD